MTMQFVSRDQVQYFENEEDVPFEMKGRLQTGHLYSALDNAPIYEGFLSPMYDGGMLRYETQEVYDVLSS